MIRLRQAWGMKLAHACAAASVRANLSMLVWVILLASLAASAADAGPISCSDPSSSHSSCTVPSGTYTSTPLLSGSGNNGGDDGPAYTLTNNGTISISSGNTQTWGLAIESKGQDGSSSDSRGGDGGNLTLTNNAPVTVAGSGTGNVLYGLYARSKGGDGSSDVDNGSDGGRGGDGGHIADGATGSAAIAVKIDNTSSVTINQSSAPNGAVGIYAEARAGQGGNQNSSVVGDQLGGNSGDAKDVRVSNSGTVTLGVSSSSLLRGQQQAWGVAAVSRGNQGGNNNGKGGTGGNITIENSGTVNVYWNGSDGTPNGVRGLYGLSQGGDGTASQDNSNTGGDGEAGYQVQVTHSGVLNVKSQSAAQGLSGGIVAISEGGNGGTAPGSNKGGDGGNGSDTTGGSDGLTRVQLTGSGQIFTDGENVAGVVARSKGGNGGNGQNGERDSSGGNGGAGGAIQIELHDSALINTSRSGSYGILGQSIGGGGGTGGDRTALLGQSGGGGYGGNGGSAAFSGTANTQISTAGDYSTAIAIQSIGGNGGTAGDFTAVLGGSGGNGGNGGDGGAVTVTSAGVITTIGRIAHGILAQSVAGSGGTGDVPTGKLALGGDGGSGGNGGDVSVTLSGRIDTSGFGARGIVAQSISGGGGDAGTLGGGFIAIGGTAGGGGSAGDVSVSTSGQITTRGAGGTGILAQSIGGGGGSGAGTAGVYAVGAGGGSGGDAAKVDVNLTGAITTQGGWANGITAQSIGGGGGDGGSALDISLFLPNFGVGAQGGAAGSSKDVTVGNYNSSTGASSGAPRITTSGQHAYGILAQSIGGGGGSGGDAVGGGAINFFTLQVGGHPADGSKGNDVVVRFRNLTLSTQGSDAIGIVAQSIGGGGGVGGSAFGGTVLNPIFSAAEAIGATGGRGGDGDTVTVTLTDSTVTTGLNASTPPSDASGILAQSIGGGGGIGGHALSGALTVGVGPEIPFEVAVTTAIGGSGQSGGDGKSVTVTLNGTTAVNVQGPASHGIVAQSIGGGGGHAGMGWTYAVAEGLGGTLLVGAGGVAVGGDGAGGGSGGDVTVSLHDRSSIITNGPDANGIIAQSIGGGGGNGGAASAGASGSFGLSGLALKTQLGGLGGGGGDGGSVHVTLDAGTSILTQSGDSFGIIAQSIGGGGGTSQGATAGGSVRAGPEFIADATLQGSLAIGMTGGSGGAGLPVTVDANGAITTRGSGSTGILAQSIGGGGGAGGSVASNGVVSGSILAFYFQSYQASMGVGGTGGSGGPGGTITINQGGTIATSGDHAFGILAQSIGGGGGLGGSAVVQSSIFKPTAQLDMVVGGSGGTPGIGSAVTGSFASGASISTSGYMAHGVVLQSIGGGGGVGGDASDDVRGRLAIGGNIGGGGGSGNRGGSVQANGALGVTTSGSDAIGLVAQSIGGGGGIGGQGNASRSSKTLSATLELAVGGGGGTGADGGSVTIGSANAPFAATVSTSGARAYGLLAQSVGGGGGIGGTGSANSLLTLTVGGQGSVAGNGGNVSVYAGTGSGTDRISTNGAGAHALVAQSVGGGGGIAGDVSSPGLSLARRFSGVNGSGSGGSVSVDFNGAIQTVGAGAFGIFAQSVGGGGGFGGDASGSFASSTSSGGSGRGGAVTVNQQGTILALGSGGIGIFAQSQGPSGSSAINVTVGGTVYGDQRGGAGVLISSGHDNSLTVTSSGFLSGNGGTAIRYQGDQSTSAGSVLNVYNYGTIFDDVILTNTSGNSAGTVYNYSNNTLVSRSLQANVVNAGTIIVGGRNEIGTTVITGNFEQTRAGTLKLDADFAAGRIDRLSVQGDAKLDGRIQVAALSLLPRALTFLDVGGTATGTLQGSRMNNLFDFSISRTGNVYTVTPDADFADPTLGLTPAQTRTAQHLQALWNAGGGSFGPLFTALAATNAGGYANLLGSVQSDTRNAPAAENLALAQQRLDRAMSCPVFAGSSAMAAQSECVWSQASGGTSNQGAFNDAAAYGDRVFAVALGGQKRIATDWFLGATAAYENSQIQSSNGGFKANGQMFSVGASVKRESGPWLLAAAAAGNFGSFDTSRFASLANLGGVAKGTQDIGGFGGRLRAAYTWAAERFYVRPFVDLDVVYTTAGGYGESGAGLFNQQVAHSANWAVLGTPSVEVGSRFDVGPDYLMRGYARVGLTVSSLHDWSVQSRFAAAPAGADSFAVMLPLDTVYGRVGAGVQLANIANALSVRLEYDGAFSGHTTRNGGAVRVSLGF